MSRSKFLYFKVGHFENDVTERVHPNLVMVVSIFHVGRGPRNKIKQVPYCPGGGCRGGVLGPWTTRAAMVKPGIGRRENFNR